MATLNYFTRTKSKSGKLVPLYARFRPNREINQVIKTPFLISPEHWNPKKQEAKHAFENTGTILTDAETKDRRRRAVMDAARESTTNLNKSLWELKMHVRTLYENSGGDIPKDWLKNTIEKYFNPDRRKKQTLFEFIRTFIDHAPTRPSPKTGKPVCYKMVREYERTFAYMKEFCTTQRKGNPLNFEDITLDFYHDFIQYLQSEKMMPSRSGKLVKEPGLAKNTTGKKIQTLKIFLNAATDEGHNVHHHYRSRRFMSFKEETDHIFLTEDEIRKMYNLDLSGKPRLEKVRDLFIIGCYTGLRYSDWSQITTENIETTDEGTKLLKIKQSKTGGEIYIPFHPMADAILQKYDGELPAVISNQKLNQYLKEVAKLAELNGSFQKTITKAGVTRTTTHAKYEVIGTHTARRSFATNLYNAGVPSLTIMQVTGHKTESAFLKYIKVTPKEHALKLAAIWKNQPEAKVRKLG